MTDRPTADPYPGYDRLDDSGGSSFLCDCPLEKRAKRRAEHMQRHDDLAALAYRLHKTGAVTEAEAHLLYQQAESEWDDAFHIASPDDPLRSLCGLYGRNLFDLPERPDGGQGCWTCLHRADELAPQPRELVTADA